MAGALDILKTILETVPGGYIDPWSEVRPGVDKILKQLSPEEVRSHEDLCELESALRSSLRKSLRLIQLFESKRFLFKDQLRLSDERAESSEDRGFALDVRKTEDGVPVLVESPLESLD